MPYGHKQSEETKKKISNNNAKFWLGKKRPFCSEETRRKLSEGNKGKRLGNQYAKGNPPNKTSFKKGLIPWIKDKKHTEESKEKNRQSHLKNPTRYWLGKKREDMLGEKHWNWQGGLSFEPYTLDWTETLKRSIRERDNYICRLCNQYGNIVHHIDYDKKNCDPDNLITLCHNCHLKTNFNRNYWINYFNGNHTKNY